MLPRCLPVLFFALPLAAFAMTGCSGTAAYINIPGDSKDVASNSVNSFNTRKLEIVALREAIHRWTPKVPFTLLLPDGTSYEQYVAVVSSIAHPLLKMPEDVPADAPVFEVSAIRTRGGDGHVDIVHPGGLRPRELAEVYVDLRTDENGTGWRVDHIEERKFIPTVPNHKAPAKPVEPVKQLEKPERATAPKEG